MCLSSMPSTPPQLSPPPPQESLAAGLSDKKPKVLLAALEVLHKTLCDFGPRVVDFKSLCKATAKCFDAKDSKARDKVRPTLIVTTVLLANFV